MNFKNMRNRLFVKKNRTVNIPLERIPWSEIIDECYDKQLSFEYNVVQVIYTNDKTERAVILQKPDGTYSVVMEKLYPFDDDELKYTISNLHGYWCPYNSRNSIFDTEELAINSIMADPPFKYNNRTE